MSGIVDEMVSRIAGEADSYLPVQEGEAFAEPHRVLFRCVCVAQRRAPSEEPLSVAERC